MSKCRKIKTKWKTLLTNAYTHIYCLQLNTRTYSNMYKKEDILSFGGCHQIDFITSIWQSQVYSSSCNIIFSLFVADSPGVKWSVASNKQYKRTCDLGKHANRNSNSILFVVIYEFVFVCPFMCSLACQAFNLTRILVSVLPHVFAFICRWSVLLSVSSDSIKNIICHWCHSWHLTL